MSDQRRHERTHPGHAADAGSGENPSEPAPEDTRPGLLKRTTAADRGLVEKPVLTPHLEYHPIEDGQVLLVSETFNTLLRGPIHSALLPLLDGRRSHRDIVAALAPAHSARDVRTAIAALASRGYVVSGDFAMERGRAAYWSSLGVSPRRAEERLSASSVAVTGDTGQLTRRLDAMGVGGDTGAPDPHRRRLRRLPGGSARCGQSTAHRVGRAVDAGQAERHAATVRPRLPARGTGAVLGLSRISPSWPPGSSRLPSQRGRRRCPAAGSRGRACARGCGIRFRGG